LQYNIDMQQLSNIESLFEQAQNLFYSGKINESKSILEQLINLHPKVPEFNYFLGLIHLKIGNINLADKNLQAALKIKPLFPLALLCKAQICINKKDFLNAKKLLGQCIDLDHNLKEAHLNLSLVFYELKEFNEGINLLESFIKKNPGSAIAYNNLGLGLIHLKNFEQAKIKLEKAKSLDNKLLDVYSNLATVYKNLFLYDESKKIYFESLKINPKNINIILSLSDLLIDKIYNEVDALNLLLNSLLFINENDKPIIYNKIGALYLSQGKKEEAINFFNKTIEISEDIHFYRALNSICSLNILTPYSKELNKAKSLLSLDSQESKWLYHIILSKIYENENENEKFFKNLKLSKKINQSIINSYFQKNKKKEIDLNHIINSLLNNKFKNNINKKISSKDNFNPIFIIGMPRSGTTLVEQIISAHPKVFGGGEISFFPDLYNQYDSKLLVGDISIDLVNEISVNYKKTLSPVTQNYNFITDKNPFNFINLQLILLCFPNAKFININRNANAVCWSIYKNDFSALGLSWVNNMSSIINFYKSYEKLMYVWNNHYSDKIFNLNYEDLVVNSNEIIPQLIKFCNLEWHQNCLFPEKNKRSVRTLSNLQIRNSIYKGSSNSWEKYSSFIPELLSAFN